MAIKSHVPDTLRRITISVPGALLDDLDCRVAAGRAATRTDLINTAIARELARLRRAEIDEEILALADDPQYQALDAQIEREFAASDGESWAQLDEDFGPEPKHANE